MPDLELSVTICSWNTVDDLRACLQSLRDEAVRTPRFEVIVVDNASGDGSPDMVRAEFPEFTLLAQDSNLGFTGGHNLALSQRRAPHAALLNSDTVVHPGAIATILDVFAGDPTVGVVGPKLLNPDGSLQYSCRRFPNPVAAAFRNTLLGRFFPKNRFVDDYLMKDFDHESSIDVDWVSGAALFIRQEVYDKLGGLDPKFFMYCEDTDYCKRTWDAGFRVLYVPQAVVTHAIGRSTDKAANKMIVRFHRSMLYYYKKHIASRSAPPVRQLLIAFAALALSARAGLFLLKNLFDDIKRRVTHKP